MGAVSEAIRKCAPKDLAEWENYYFANIRPKSHLIDLGKRLYVKITEVLVAEIDAINEQDCIDYLINLVIDRTFDGFQTEITTIYWQLQKLLAIKIQPAPDEWDRLYNIDFYIEVNRRFIGLQIKPTSDVSHITQIFKERELQKETHARFTAEFGGAVFYVISLKKNEQKTIENVEVIDSIKAEIRRLESQP